MRVTTAAGQAFAETKLIDKYGNTSMKFPYYGTYQIGFTKPDKPVINEPVQGYRKPSSYACPAFSSSTGAYGTRGIPVRYSISGKSQGWEMEGSLITRVQTFDNTPNANNVRMKVLNNLRSEVLDVAMVLAEISGTANTLANNLVRIGRSMDAIKRRKPESFYFLLNGRRRDNRRPTDKFLRETAGAYLEWKYGVMPIVYDVQGACKALDMSADGSLFDNPPLLVARARDVNTDTRAAQITIAEASGDRRNTSIPVTVRSEYKARLDYRVSGDLLRGLNRYGIGLGSVATVLFDRTPFSFVLNMAVPIAELIKAWTALAGVDVVGYCETVHRTTQVRAMGLPVTLRGAPVQAMVEECNIVDWYRQAYSAVPMPLPYVRNPVRVGNAATVLALFTQLRKPE